MSTSQGLIGGDNQLVQPTGCLWVTLKSIFIVFNIVLFAESGLLIWACVALFQIINNDKYSNSTGINTQLLDWVKVHAETNAALVIVMIILTFAQSLSGLVGILRTKLLWLNVYQGLIAISLIISLVDLFINLSVAIPLTVIAVKCVIMIIAGKLTKMIQEANFIV